MARRDEEKKRRRQKRLEKQQAKQTRWLGEAGPGFAGLKQVLGSLAETLSVPEPASWPGASDPSLARPDRVKFELAEFAIRRGPGRAKYRTFEDALRQGHLGFLPHIDHWAIEEFCWHGVPGDPWHPVEAFLESAGERFPPAAREQLRLWKQARIGLFEVGDVRDDTVGLQEWDPVRGTAVGPAVRAITLNLGGTNLFRGKQGFIQLTYLAPWAPADHLSCGMGYGTMMPKKDAIVLLMYLGLRHPEVVARPAPWKASRAAADAYLREWQHRDWYGWLGERLQFPFHALVQTPPQGKLALKLVQGLIPTTAEQAWRFGIYFEVPGESEVMVAGATAVTPIDVALPNFAALMEYHAYRDRAGPPPGTVGQPNFLRVR